METTNKIDPAVARKERVAALSRKANDLKKVGFYSKEDVLGIKNMLDAGMCLTQIEWLVQDAYELSRKVPA